MEALPMTPNDVSVALYRPQPGIKSIAVRRAMLSMPAVMDSLDSIEKAVFVATTDKPFDEYDDNELIMTFAGSLKWIAKDVGLRDTESPDFKAAVVRVSQIAKRYYPNLTIKDVKMAFELTVTGELNDYFPKDRNGNPDKDHYQMFNADYFCKIINAYRHRRSSVIAKANKAVPQPEQERDPKKDAYYRNCTRRSLIMAVLEYKYRGRWPQISPIMEMLAYDMLADLGLAEPYEITQQEQTRILEQTIAEYERKLQYHDARRLRNAGTNADEIKYNSTRAARKKALKAAFDYIIDNEIQITDYIKYERI